MIGVFRSGQDRQSTSGLRATILCAALALFSASLLARAASSQEKEKEKGALRVYFIDVEGGQATLFVTPEK